MAAARAEVTDKTSSTEGRRNAGLFYFTPLLAPLRKRHYSHHIDREVTMEQKERTNRNIRLSNEEWRDFKRLLGAAWLRGQIANAVKREKRQPIAKRSDEE